MSRSNSGPGSITQWIATCHCSELVIPDDSIGKDPILLCTLCNKRISMGRVGSLTQWVFRSDLCRCENPSPVQATDAEVQSAVGTMMDDLTLSQEFGQAVEGLLIDEDVFPIDRYKPLREIGRGVSGIVYMSVDRMLRKHVAIKCLQTLSAKQLVDFQKEAQATSKLDHPNIIKVFDFGATESGAPYMVMEYAEGNSLDHYIETNGVLSEPMALSVLMQLASALGHAHARGIFHRDIKGSNLLIVKGNAEDDTTPAPLEVRVIDLGIATLKEALFETNKGNTIAGTPAYMSPDQFYGKPFDARSEVYSVGCLFFEMLTGRPPYVAQGAIEVVNLHVNQEIPRLSEANPDSNFSPVADEIVQRCLAKEPDERFQTMADLQAFIEDPDLAVLEAPLSDSQAALTPVASGRRDRVMPLIAFLVATVFIIFGGIAYSIWQNLDAATTPTIALRSAGTPTFSENEDAFERVLKGASLGESQAFKIVSTAPNQVVVEGADTTSSFAKLRSIVGLNDVFLRNSTINGSMISVLRDCKLATLTIELCRFSNSALVGLSELTTLNRLTIRKTPAFAVDGLKYLKGLSLTRLLIESIDLSEASLKLLGRMHTLSDLTIQNCTTFDEHGLVYLQKLHLKSLQLMDTPFAADGLRSIQKMDSLQTLALTSTDFVERPGYSEEIKHTLGAQRDNQTPYDPEAFAGIASLRSLSTLAIDCDRMELSQFVALKNFADLKSLSLSIRRPMSDDNWEALRDLSNLRSLKIIGAINGDNLSKIVKMNRLQTLILCNSELTDSDVSELADSNLETLSILGDNTLSDSGLNSLSKMPMLAKLRLPEVSFITAYGLESFVKLKPNCQLVKRDL
ncbi:MAG: serine/threonine protein kinase [Candidatus Obscuribacterales bacterium]|nr:serine/threonine protein kinase [Candidatus Obscuribacterales bacterium]